VVHRHELLGALYDVFVFRNQRHGLPIAQMCVYVHHGQPANADVGRLLHQLHHIRLPEVGWSAIVPGVPDQCYCVVFDVLQLSIAVR